MKKLIIAIVVILIITIKIFFDAKEDENIYNFNFNLNEKTHYILEYSTIFDNDGVAYEIGSNINMSAYLNVRVLQKDKKFVYVGFEFSKVDITFGNSYLEDRLNKLYSIFFIIKMNYNGEFLQYYFPSAEDEIKGLANIISMLETKLSHHKSYSAKEKDLNGGLYDVSYYTKDANLYKSRNSYKSKSDNDSLKIVLQDSSIKIVPDTTKNWLLLLEGVEDLVTKDGVNDMIKNRNKINLEKLKSPVDEQLLIWKTDKTVAQLIELFAQKSKESEFSWEKEGKKALKRVIKENNINLMNLVAVVKEKNNLSSMNDLKIYLELNPDEIYKLEEIILNSEDSVSSSLINVLEILNKIEAQKLLLKIVDDDRYSADNNLRAVIALGTQKNLDIEIIDSLWDIQNVRDDEDGKTRSDTIVLALGSISSYSKSDISDGIEQKLKSLLSDNSYSKGLLLYAMENSGADKFTQEAIEIFINSTDERLKVSAIDVLQNIKSDEVYTLLYDEMKNTSSDTLKAQTIKVLLKFKVDERILKDINDNIRELPSSSTKIEMVNYLIKSVEQYPENRIVLKDILRDIQDDETKKMIIKTIRN